MEVTVAQGSCENCGQFTRAEGADEEDARILLSHHHGSEHGYAFEGDCMFKREDTNRRKGGKAK